MAALMAPGSGLTPVSPTETLGAGCDREDVAYRFLVDDLIEPILHDNRTQDALLRQQVEPKRLEHWFGICQEEAKALVEEEAEQTGKEQKAAEELADTMKAKEKTQGVVLSGYEGGRAHWDQENEDEDVEEGQEEDEDEDEDDDGEDDDGDDDSGREMMDHDEEDEDVEMS